MNKASNISSQISKQIKKTRFINTNKLFANIAIKCFNHSHKQEHSSTHSSHKLVTVSHYKENPKIAFLTIDNAKKRNALPLCVLEEMNLALKKIASEYKDSHGKRSSVIILNSEGSVFSSGHDLKELSSVSSAEQKNIFNLCGEVAMMINSSPSIFISEIQGICAAAGLQLASACDLSIASSNAEFSTPGIKVGLFCTTPSIEISQLISPKRAMHMLLTGESIDAETALNWGLINKVVDVSNKDYTKQREILREATIDYAEEITKFSSQTYCLGKEAFYKQLPMKSLKEKYEYGGKIMSQNFELSDCKEGVSAFVEKRKPKFNH